MEIAQTIGMNAAGNIIALGFVLAIYRVTISENQGRDPSLKSLGVIVGVLLFLAICFFTAQ